MPIVASYIVPHPPLIIPDIGRGDETSIQKTIDAYNMIAKEISEIKPDTIIISSPHANSFLDYFHISPHKTMKGDFSQFGAYEVEIYTNSDSSLIQSIEREAKSLDFPMGTLGSKDNKLDHGVSVPLYFINKYYDTYKVVIVGPSRLGSSHHYRAGKIIHSSIPKNKKVVWIASGDLSHKLTETGPYGFEKSAPSFDKETTKLLKDADFLQLLMLSPKYCQKVAECGIGSFTMMAGALDGLSVNSELLSYEGPFGVGYAVIKYTNFTENSSRHFDVIYKSIMDDSIHKIRKTEDAFVQLARQALEQYVLTKHKLKVPKTISSELVNGQAGVFVSLHINNQLRGCIGTVIPTKPTIAEEIIDNAISAGTRDYRFQEVSKNELNNIEYSVDVLLPPEQIDAKEKLDVKKYGVIVSSGHKTGLLLPNLEGIDTIDEQINIAKEKAGIKNYEDYKLHRFEVIRHH